MKTSGTPSIVRVDLIVCRATLHTEESAEYAFRPTTAQLFIQEAKAQEPDGKITWARRSKRLAPYGDEYRTEQKRPPVIWRQKFWHQSTLGATSL